MRKVRLLVISSPSLSKVIGHLFRGRSEFEVVGSVNSLRALRRESERLLPELIVAHIKPLRTRVCRAVASIKECSPFSKLILICSIRDFMGDARQSGADACLEQEKLVHHLLPTARALHMHLSPAIPQEASIASAYRAHFSQTFRAH